MKFAITIVIPCYNCIQTLETTVESVRGAGLSNYELLLIDDGSTDGTDALCDALCAKYPELRCVHQPNAGVSAARNRGIDEARGDYLWFVDSDDTVDPDSLTYAAGIAAQQQPDMLIFGMSFDYYHRGRIYRREKLTPPCEGILTTEQLKMRFQEFYSCNALTPVWNKLFRRELLVSSGVRFHEDMILMEDFLYVLELLPFCRSIYSLPEAIYHYRQAEDESKIIGRLRRIYDIDAFMQPFLQGIQTLGESGTSRQNGDFSQGWTVLESLYFMLMRQRIYMASLNEIHRVSAEYIKTCEKWSFTLPPDEHGRIFCDMRKKRCLSILLRNRMSIFKHQIKERMVRRTALHTGILKCL